MADVSASRTGIDAAQGLVEPRLKSRDKALTDALDRLADRMVNEIRQDLGVMPDGKHRRR